MNGSTENIDLDLSGLGEIKDEGDLTEQELQENARDLLWISGEMPPPEDIAHSLHRLDAAAGSALDALERIALAGERIAAALEGAVAAFGAAKPDPSDFGL